MADAFTIHSSALPTAARLVGFHGTAGLSRLYRFDVLLMTAHDLGQEIDLKSVVGARATIRFEGGLESAPAVVVNGIFATVELVKDVGGRSVFQAVLVPRLWHLTRSLHSRVFTQETIPAILESVLQKGGLAGGYELALTGNYATEEHVCQYAESDFDFLSRWMEREGIYYYFEQDDGAERLVLTDHLATHVPLGDRPLRYFPQDEGVFQFGAFRAFSCRQQALPASVTLKDYDYTRPKLAVGGQAPVSPAGVGEISVHGVRFFTPDDGARLARVKAESLLAEEAVYRGSCGSPHLRVGYLFEVEDHPRASLNTRYLATELEIWGTQATGTPELRAMIPWDDTLRVDVTAIAATVQYRAPQKTPWPRIYGTEHAVVDGPAASDYAQIDSQGRYAVKFHFDESDLSGGKASTWVRMIQPHGGSIEGFHFPLRVGTEVVCTFSGGDPDRPVISGVAPNALTPSPVTSGNHTRNVIQTGGRNRMEFEDSAGQERITISTPQSNTYIRMGAPNDDHNMIITTEGSSWTHTAGHHESDVEGDRMTTTIGASTSWVGGLSMSTVLGGNIRLTTPFSVDAVLGWRRSYTKGWTYSKFLGPRTTIVMAADTTTVNGLRTTTIDGDNVSTITGDSRAEVRGVSSSRFLGDRRATVYGLNKTTVIGRTEGVYSGYATNTYTNGRKVIVGVESVTEITGKSVSQINGDSKTTIVGLRDVHVDGESKTVVTGDSVSEVRGLYQTKLNDRVERIKGFKYERIDGVAYKKASLEVKNADDLATKVKGTASLVATLRDIKTKLDLCDADLHVLK